MKQIIFLILFIFLIDYSYGQKNVLEERDSTLIEVFMSNPQPRISEFTSINIKTSPLIDTIFNSLSEGDKNNVTKSYPNDLTIGNVETSKIGKFKIGSLHFSMNNTNYYTKELNYEVIDSLPESDKGLWIRAIKIDDSTFCLIMEQRIPKIRNEVQDSLHPNLTLYDEILRRATFAPSTTNLSSMRGEGASSFKNKLVRNVEKSFLESSYISFIRIVNRNEKITLTKDDFENIPKDYIFHNIIIE